MNKPSPEIALELSGKSTKSGLTSLMFKRSFGDLYYWWKKNKELLNFTARYRKFEDQKFGNSTKLRKICRCFLVHFKKTHMCLKT